MASKKSRRKKSVLDTAVEEVPNILGQAEALLLLEEDGEARSILLKWASKKGLDDEVEVRVQLFDIMIQMGADSSDIRFKMNELLTSVRDFFIAQYAWDQVRSQHSRCCGDRPTLEAPQGYFHGEHWEDSYPCTQAIGEEDASVTVEFGLRFMKRGVQPYWIFDNDSTAVSYDFGEEIPYPSPWASSSEWSLWVDTAENSGNYAAEAAWNNDVLTCSKCGYHFFSFMGCGCDDSLDEEDGEDEGEG